jgi:hypothetical protein
LANGKFVSTSINLKNKSAGDGCQDKTIEKTILRAFRVRMFPHSQGQKETFGGANDLRGKIQLRGARRQSGAQSVGCGPS